MSFLCIVPDLLFVSRRHKFILLSLFPPYKPTLIPHTSVTIFSDVIVSLCNVIAILCLLFDCVAAGTMSPIWSQNLTLCTFVSLILFTKV